MNQTFAECYILDKDYNVAKAVFEACKNENYVLKPELIKKANGHHVVMCGFEDRDHMQVVVGRFEKLFQGKLSWR